MKSSQAGRSSKKSVGKMAEQIGQRIIERRLLCGMSQKTLGEKANLSAGGLSAIENGLSKVSAESLWRITNVLSVSIHYFFYTKK